MGCSSLHERRLLQSPDSDSSSRAGMRKPITRGDTLFGTEGADLPESSFGSLVVSDAFPKDNSNRSLRNRSLRSTAKEPVEGAPPNGVREVEEKSPVADADGKAKPGASSKAKGKGKKLASPGHKKGKPKHKASPRPAEQASAEIQNPVHDASLDSLFSGSPRDAAQEQAENEQARAPLLSSKLKPPGSPRAAAKESAENEKPKTMPRPSKLKAPEARGETAQESTKDRPRSSSKLSVSPQTSKLSASPRTAGQENEKTKDRPRSSSKLSASPQTSKLSASPRTAGQEQAKTKRKPGHPKKHAKSPTSPRPAVDEQGLLFPPAPAPVVSSPAADSPLIVPDDATKSPRTAPKAQRTRPKLAALQKASEESPEETYSSDSDKRREKSVKIEKAKSKTKKTAVVVTPRVEVSSPTEPVTSSAAEGQTLQPTRAFSISFRFLLYNMANQKGLSMDGIGSGFLRLREMEENTDTGSTQVNNFKNKKASVLTNIGTPTAKSTRSSAASRRSGSEAAKTRPLSLSNLITEGIEMREPDSELTSIQESCIPDAAADMARQSSQSAPSPKTATKRVELRPFSSDQDEESPTWRKIRPSMTEPAMGMKRQKTLMERIAVAPSSLFNRMTLPMQRSTKLQMNRTRTTTSVDCVFGALAESQFALDDLAKSIDMQGHGHFHSQSALEQLSELGHVSGMKGAVAGRFSGDMKAFMLTRNTFKEVPNADVFCSFDEDSQSSASGNPIKSFIGQTFDAAGGSVQFVLLGTHFPMKKIASMMEDNVTPPAQMLQKMKVIMARLLQKVLRHLLTKDLINEKTMIILQGDLNSRCIYLGGVYVDLLWETMQDSHLQYFMSMDVPNHLKGEWREVVDVPDQMELPATYRFSQSASSCATQSKLRLKDIFGQSTQDAPPTYRDALDRMKFNGTMQEWGLYDPKLEDEKPKEAGSSPKKEKSKFKPSRLPSCTERVIYYAPSYLQDCCRWETSRGYEVNYLEKGSDHRPVMLEATLIISEAPERPLRIMSFGSDVHNSVPASDVGDSMFEDDGSGTEVESDDSRDSDRRNVHSSARFSIASKVSTAVAAVRPNRRCRTAVHLSAMEGVDLE